jgi:gliding-associated putative ABC transporter substrate-binding component GldG
LDFTTNKRYSLSNVSKEVIQNNNEPIVVDFYVSEDLPQNIQKLAQEFLSLLKEYKSISKTDFSINIIHPNTLEKEMQANQAGIDIFFQEIREKDVEKVQRIFMGAVFHIGERDFVIPRIDFDTPLEYRITSLFKQISNPQKPLIGFIQGHDETHFNRMPQFINELSHITEIQWIDLNKSENLSRYQVICIINPKHTYSTYELEQLEKYLSQGGRLFIALNHAIAQLGERNSGFINPTGIEKLLEKKGLKIKYDFVVDNNCGTIAINQHYGLLNFQSNLHFPYVPIITNFSNHPITQGLKSLLLPFTSSIKQVKTSSTYIFTPLARTSSISGTKEAPIFFDYQKQWTQKDFNHPHNIVAALLTNEDNNSAIVTITDADFVLDNIVSTSFTDNIKFIINSIEWLADNSGLIQLRNKYTVFSFLEPVSEPYKELLKYLNLFLPIILVIIGALIFYHKQLRKRLNRSRHGYLD